MKAAFELESSHVCEKRSNSRIHFRRFCFSDVDECATGAHNCSLDASCINTNGSFVCFSEFGCKVDGATQLISKLI